MKTELTREVTAYHRKEKNRRVSVYDLDENTLFFRFKRYDKNFNPVKPTCKCTMERGVIVTDLMIGKDGAYHLLELLLLVFWDRFWSKFKSDTADVNAKYNHFKNKVGGGK